MRTLKWRPRASLDRESITIYLGFDRQNPQAALKTLETIDKAIEQVLQFPESGRRVSFDHLEHTDYRFIVAGNYKVFYRFDESALTIVRVLHQRQDIDPRSLIELV